MQTPKRPNLPPTPITHYKTSLPPLSSILQTHTHAHSTPGQHEHVPNTPFGGLPRLPSMDIFNTPMLSKALHHQPRFQSAAQPHHQSRPHSLTLGTPSKFAAASKAASFSFANTSVDNSEADITPSDSVMHSKTSSPTESRAYAFISHSPATFPNKEPSIDNAPLARRKRRRTSPNELSILNQEFDIGSTPNKPRRIEIAKRVSMTEKAVQIWFQNKRQSLRKHSLTEREVTELPQVNTTVSTAVNTAVNSPIAETMPPPVPTASAPPILNASTPIKPALNKSQSFISPSSHNAPSPVSKRSMSTNLLPRLPPGVAPHFHRSSKTSSPDASQLVLNETRKKQPGFLNSNSSSTMTFKLAPAKARSPKREQADRRPLADITATSTNKVRAKLDSIKTGENECIEHLLALREGSWK